MLLGVNKKRTNLPASAGQAPAPRANFRQSVSGLLVATLLFSAPYSGAAADKSTPQAPTTTVKLDKKFKGKLPITELTEDQAIMHAMNRLAYGPRPGDVEFIRKLGLEKWIDQQLQPNSIDDSALETRLQRGEDFRGDFPLDEVIYGVLFRKIFQLSGNVAPDFETAKMRFVI